MIGAIFLLVILVLVGYLCFFKRKDYWEKRNVPAKSSNGFLLGKGMVYVLQDVYDQFPENRYVGLYQLGESGLLVRDPELIKLMTVKDFEYFHSHRSFSVGVDALWSRNLLSLGGQEWKNMRATLSPSFTGSKMRLMHPLVMDCAKKYVEHLVNDGAKEYNMKDFISRFATDVIATASFGLETDSWKDKNNEFYLMGREASDMTSFRKMVAFFIMMFSPKMSKFLGIKMFSKSCGNFFKNLVKKTVEIREKNGIVRQDMINLLMESRKEHPEELLTLEDMTAQALIFFFAGFETVSTTLCFITYELAVNPNIQEKLRQEIENALNENNGELTYETLSKLKYMEMVIMESLRKWPGGALLDRKCTKNYTIEPVKPGETPVIVEEGTTIIFPLFSIQRDPQFWPNPDVFDPERFSDGIQEAGNNCLHLGFGNGPRNCIGKRFAFMEMKNFLAFLLLSVELKPSKKTPIPMKLNPNSLTLTAVPGFYLDVVPRNK